MSKTKMTKERAERLIRKLKFALYFGCEEDRAEASYRIRELTEEFDLSMFKWEIDPNGLVKDYPSTKIVYEGILFVVYKMDFSYWINAELEDQIEGVSLRAARKEHDIMTIISEWYFNEYLDGSYKYY